MNPPIQTYYIVVNRDNWAFHSTQATLSQAKDAASKWLIAGASGDARKPTAPGFTGGALILQKVGLLEVVRSAAPEVRYTDLTAPEKSVFIRPCPHFGDEAYKTIILNRLGDRHYLLPRLATIVLGDEYYSNTSDSWIQSAAIHEQIDTCGPTQRLTYRRQLPEGMV